MTLYRRIKKYIKRIHRDNEALYEWIIGGLMGGTVSVILTVLYIIFKLN